MPLKTVYHTRSSNGPNVDQRIVPSGDEERSSVPAYVDAVGLPYMRV